MRICNVVEYKEVLKESERLAAEWNNYYEEYERGSIDFYEYILITNELEIKINILDKAIAEWESRN